MTDTPTAEQHLMNAVTPARLRELEAENAQLRKQYENRVPTQWAYDAACNALHATKAKLARAVEGLRKVNASTFSHIDGRDLLAELHPRKQLDIKRRRDGVDTWFEGDWLSNLSDAMEEARAILAEIETVGGGDA